MTAEQNQKSLVGYGRQPALFLDRDGVIVHDVPYNKDPQKVALREGIVELISKAHDKGFWVVVVSNQSGLGRGVFSWTDYRVIHQKICRLLAEQGQWLDLSLCAPFYEGTLFKEAQERPHFRKPDVGMFEHAAKELGIDFSQSLMVGDSATDLVPAEKCGIKKLYLAKVDKTDEETKKLSNQFSYQLVESLSEIHI